MRSTAPRKKQRPRSLIPRSCRDVPSPPKPVEEPEPAAPNSVVRALLCSSSGDGGAAVPKDEEKHDGRRSSLARQMIRRWEREDGTTMELPYDDCALVIKTHIRAWALYAANAKLGIIKLAEQEWETRRLDELDKRWQVPEFCRREVLGLTFRAWKRTWCHLRSQRKRREAHRHHHRASIVSHTGDSIASGTWSPSMSFATRASQAPRSPPGSPQRSPARSPGRSLRSPTRSQRGDEASFSATAKSPSSMLPGENASPDLEAEEAEEEDRHQHGKRLRQASPALPALTDTTAVWGSSSSEPSKPKEETTTLLPTKQHHQRRRVADASTYAANASRPRRFVDVNTPRAALSPPLEHPPEATPKLPAPPKFVLTQPLGPCVMKIPCFSPVFQRKLRLINFQQQQADINDYYGTLRRDTGSSSSNDRRRSTASSRRRSTTSSYARGSYYDDDLDDDYDEPSVLSFAAAWDNSTFSTTATRRRRDPPAHRWKQKQQPSPMTTRDSIPPQRPGTGGMRTTTACGVRIPAF